MTNSVYDTFAEQYKDFARDLYVTFMSCKHLLPASEENEFYNRGATCREERPFSPNIILADAHYLSASYANSTAENKTERGAGVVSRLLEENGVPRKDDNEVLFYDDNKAVTRRDFYNLIYEHSQSNTNFFSQHIGGAQIITLPDVDGLPKSAAFLPDDIKSRIDAIAPDTLKSIILKRGLYHEAVHTALRTDDERKCDTFALLKVMQEHPAEALAIFDMYNFARSKSGYTVKAMRKAVAKGNISGEVKNGTMTYLMPNTYAQMKKYALKPELLQGKDDAELLKMTFEITRLPEFSRNQLADFEKMLRRPDISKRDLAQSDVVKACMQQANVDNISNYMAIDKNLATFIAEEEIAKTRQLLSNQTKTEKTPTDGQTASSDTQNTAVVKTLPPQTTR